MLPTFRARARRGLATVAEPLLLYGSEQSLYSGKVRAYLRYRKLPFVEVLCTRDVYRRKIIPSVGWPVVPVVSVPGGPVLQDSTQIIGALDTSAPEGRSVTPPGPMQRFASRLLNFFADEWLLLPAMWYRWGPPEHEEYLIHEFGLVSAGPGASAEERGKAGLRAYRGFRATVTSGLLGINESTIPALEASYHAFLAELSSHLDRHQFLLGDRPSLGDFGFAAPLYAHLGRDPLPHYQMKTRAPRVADYVERLGGGASSRLSPVPADAVLPTHTLQGELRHRDDRLGWDATSTVRGGGWHENDELPPTLLPLLRRQCAEQLPVTAANSAALRRRLQRGWPQGTPLADGIAGLSGTPDDADGLGWFDAAPYGVPTSLAVRPNVTMMAQDLVDDFAALPPAEREAVEEGVLRPAGGEDAVAAFAAGEILAGCPRLRRRDFKLWADEA